MSSEKRRAIVDAGFPPVPNDPRRRALFASLPTLDLPLVEAIEQFMTAGAGERSALIWMLDRLKARDPHFGRAITALYLANRSLADAIDHLPTNYS